MVTTAQLAAIMGGDIDYSQHVAAANEAVQRAQCTTALRQAMFLAQVGHESAGLRYFREIDPGYYLRGRSDLGHGPGEGEQWRGAGPIQLTGKNNFRAFGDWCHAQGLVADPEVFVRQPELVATPRWGWLSASYYWTVARPDINQLADDGDIIGVTRRINGGTNGLDDRERRYRLALRILRKETPMAEKEKMLPYSRDQVTQDTGYFCGPASCQTVIRAATGKLIDEFALAVELGTTDEGTSSIDHMPPVLNRYIPGALYEYRVMPNDPPTPTQTELLWDDITASIAAGHGVIANIVAPPDNYPRGVNGSISPAYSGGTVFHYIAIMGTGEDENGDPCVWVADSGFWPYGYWLGLEQLATLIPPKGYAYSTAAPQQEGLFMGLPQDRQEDLARKIDDIHTILTRRLPSRSGYRTTDEPIDTLAGFVLNADARLHEQAVLETAQATGLTPGDVHQRLVAGQSFVEILEGEK